MPGRTYTNKVIPEEISLAVEQFLIAPYGTAFTPARLDPSSPPAGFYNMGGVVEDSVSIAVTREAYELRTGLPRSRQYVAIVGVDGQITGRIYTHMNRKLDWVFGTVRPRNTTETTATSATVTSNTEVTLAGSPSEDWYVGDFIVHSTASAGTTGVTTSTNIAVITSISGADVYFGDKTDNLGFEDSIASNDWFAKMTYSQIPFGTGQIQNLAVIGIADFTDGTQVLHYFPKVNAAGDWSEALNPGGVPEMAFQFNAIAYTSTIYTGAEESVVGERYWIPPDNSS